MKRERRDNMGKEREQKSGEERKLVRKKQKMINNKI